eukprot:1694702-Karenia_brevis.AAC.1
MGWHPCDHLCCSLQVKVHTSSDDVPYSGHLHLGSSHGCSTSPEPFEHTKAIGDNVGHEGRQPEHYCDCPKLSASGVLYPLRRNAAAHTNEIAGSRNDDYAEASAAGQMASFIEE